MIPIQATIEEPEQGTWIADLIHQDPYEGSFDLGEVTWIGTAVSSVLDGTRYFTRVMGGKGKLTNVLRDQYYYGGGSGNTIISDILRAAGESGAPNVPARVETWSRQASTAGQQLTEICQALSVVWWADRAGQVTAGVRATGEVDLSLRTIVTSDVDGSLAYASESSLGLLPGMTIGGKTIRHVRWELVESRLTAEVSYVAFRLSDLRGGLDYLRTHRAAVESQEADGTLNLIVGNRFSITKCPWLGGLAGSTKILPGDVVTVASWGGDPRQWFAFGLQRTPGPAIARVGDTVDCGVLLFSQTPAGPAGTVVVFSEQVLPDPKDTFEARLSAATLKAATAGGPPIVAPITGVISSGSERNTSS